MPRLPREEIRVRQQRAALENEELSIATELLQAARKGLKSESAAERAEALRTVRRHLDDKHTALEQEAEKLRKQVEQIPALQEEVEELKQTVAALKENARRNGELHFATLLERAERERALVNDSTAQLQKAEEIRSEAKAITQRAQLVFDQQGWGKSVEKFQEMVKALPMPDFFDPANAGHVPAFWGTWLELETAIVWCQLQRKYALDPQHTRFKVDAVKVFSGEAKNDAPDKLEAIQKYFEVRADYLNLRQEIVAEVRAKVEEENEKRRKLAADLMWESHSRAQLRGAGRTPVAADEPVYVSRVPIEEHLLGCQCPVCNPERYKTKNWLDEYLGNGSEDDWRFKPQPDPALVDATTGRSIADLNFQENNDGNNE